MSARRPGSGGAVGTVLDTVLDRSLVGYTRLGPALRGARWPADPEPGSMTGRRVVVTGATSGIGQATATGLARLGATVHLLGRDPAKVTRAAADLRRAVAGAEVVEEVCDVGDLDAVRRWAGGLAERVEALHGLVHNAGAMPPERTETPQGHELALAVHVLGPHLMTHLLRGTLQAGGGSVVWMASGGMYSAALTGDPDEIESRGSSYSGIRAYARTKRMQVALADAWARTLVGTGVRVESMHPGWAGTPGITGSMPGFGRVMGPLLRTAEDGADTAVWLVATQPRSTSPHFWHDRAQRPSTLGWQRREDPAVLRGLLDHVEAATGAAL